MNDARLKENQRAQMLIGEAKGILEVAANQERDDFDQMPQDLQKRWERAEEAVDALELAAMCCDEAISACVTAWLGRLHRALSASSRRRSARWHRDNHARHIGP
jgi:hypothetical protein